MVVAASNHVSTIPPRVLIVSRRSIRKNKFVDFVGEYHLDLLVSYGAVPVIVPRVRGVHSLLESFEPIHGVLLCEGEDIDPSLYLHHDHDLPGLSPEDMEEVRRVHSGDTTVDKEKDSIELALAELCLGRGIPFLGICRGSQILNVASGGTLYQDIEKELTAQRSNCLTTTKHIDYDNYDGHRHAARVVEDTPLHRWFEDSLEADRMEIMVNSYHHQGVKRLAKRFVAMAYAPDGLIEGFYDPNQYDPDEGQFLMGLQFHPERMRRSASHHDDFDYPGCPAAYQEFVKAAIAFQAKTEGRIPKLNKEMEIKRKTMVKSISLAKLIHLSSGAEFVEANTRLSRQEEKRLKQMGATVRNSTVYLKRMKRKEEEERGAIAIAAMEKLSVERLSDILSFHHMMAHLCSDLINKKLQSIIPLQELMLSL